jgi:hypothetical protein
MVNHYDTLVEQNEENYSNAVPTRDKTKITVAKTRLFESIADQGRALEHYEELLNPQPALEASSFPPPPPSTPPGRSAEDHAKSDHRRALQRPNNAPGITGATTEYPRSWWITINAQLSMLSIDSNTPEACNWVAQAFQDNARKWWAGLIAQHPSFPVGSFFTVSEMQAAYLLMFESEPVADAASAKLRALHTVNNNIPEMQMNFNALVTDLGPTCMDDGELMRQYFSKLPPKYQEHLSTKKAEFKAAGHKTRLQSMQQAAMALHQTWVTTAAARQVDNDNKRGASMIPPASPVKFGTSPTGAKTPKTACRLCPGQFHFNETCPKRQQPATPPASQTPTPSRPSFSAKPARALKNSPSSKSFNGACFICKETGHRAADCPNKETFLGLVTEMLTSQEYQSGDE